MIQFNLKCAEGHKFASWFKSADAFDKLKGNGMVACAVCGSTDIEKALMAPRVSTARKTANSPEPEVETENTPAERPLSTPATAAEQAIAELRKKIEATSENVGTNFVREARAMHEGEAPERSIYGQARLDEAKQLVEDGIPVAPLPFMPGRKTN